jgi:very-short-patch-repair endonuclease
MLSYNKSIKQLSRNPRRNMTDAEKLLWSKIRGKQLKGFQFYRQKIIGNYIADFYCPKKKLVIEVDGGQHYSDDGKEKDCMRDDYMASVGINVMRFSDRDVLKNLDAVLEEIWRQL